MCSFCRFFCCLVDVRYVWCDVITIERERGSEGARERNIAKEHAHILTHDCAYRATDINSFIHVSNERHGFTRSVHLSIWWMQLILGRSIRWQMPFWRCYFYLLSRYGIFLFLFLSQCECYHFHVHYVSGNELASFCFRALGFERFSSFAFWYFRLVRTYHIVSLNCDVLRWRYAVPLFS